MHRTSRDLARGLVALASVIGLLVGVPAVLARFGGWPLPTYTPSVGGVLRGLTQELQVIHVIKALLVVCWICWLVMAWALLAELAAMKSGHVPRPRRSLAPFQLFAARLVAGVALLVSVASPAASAASASPLPVRAEVPVLVAAGVRLAPAAASSTTSTSWSVSPPSMLNASTAPEGSITVQPRDTLHRLAELHLGDAMRWRDIWNLNRNHVMVDGSTFSRPEMIRPGWVLQLPASVAVTPASADAALPAVVAATAVVVVAEGDDLSTLAARNLGDADKWPQIYQANKGRSFDGVTFNEPDLILPGWELKLPAFTADQPVTPAATPANSVVSSAPTGSTSTAAATSAVVDGSSQINAPASALPASAGTVAASTVAQATTESTVSQASIVAPTSTVTPAPTATPAPVAPALGDPASTPAPVAPVPVDPARAAQDWTIERTALGLAGATLLATGVALLVATRRRRRLRSMGPDHRLPAPHASVTETEAEVQTARDSRLITRVDLALRVFAAMEAAPVVARTSVVFDSAANHDAQPQMAQPCAVLVLASGEIDLLLDRPSTQATTPFARRGDGSTVRLPADITTLELAGYGAVAASPCPTLVLIGAADIDGASARVFVDLETLGGLQIAAGSAGEGEVHDILRAMAASLVVSPLGIARKVIVDGIQLDALAGTTSVEVSADRAQAIQSALVHTSGRRHDAPHTPGFILRATQPDEAWETAVIVTGGGDIDGQLAAAAGKAGVIIVSGEPVDGIAATLALTDEGWRLKPLGLLVTPFGIALPTLDRLASVLADAVTPPELLPPPEMCPDLPPFVGTDFSFLVRLLGPVDVVSRAKIEVDFNRSKALELVVWLTQHHHNPSRTSARTALWQNGVQDTTVSNVVSDARTAMSSCLPHPDGAPWIGRNGDKLPLDPTVRTDVELVHERLAWARHAPDPLAIPVLSDALDMVRDVPFCGTDYFWSNEDALVSNLIHLSTSTATGLAQRCLRGGDYDGVFAATSVGLRVLPGHDELVCLRMQAHHGMGNNAGVRSEFVSYERVITSGCDGESDLSPRVTRMRAHLLDELIRS